MVLFVSEGPEYEVAEESRANRSDQWSINGEIRDATEALNRVNAVVFAIDPRGVSSGNADQIHASSVFETAGVGTAAIQKENLRAFGVVQAISANTGGFTMLWRSNMSRDLRRVIAADSSYYHKLRRTINEPREISRHHRASAKEGRAGECQVRLFPPRSPNADQDTVGAG